MRTVVICRLAPGTAIADMAAHLPAEAERLAWLRDAGTLLEAYSPGGPGAVLFLEVRDVQEAQSVADGLPMKVAGLIETEVIGLYPLRY